LTRLDDCWIACFIAEFSYGGKRNLPANSFARDGGNVKTFSCLETDVIRSWPSPPTNPPNQVASSARTDLLSRARQRTPQDFISVWQRRSRIAIEDPPTPAGDKCI